MSETSSAAETDTTELLKSALLREMEQNGATKRQALRVAIVWAINSGALPAGLRMPAETKLARDLEVSLGTVQKALGQVQNLGLIKRRRGDGTRVLDCSVLPSNIWHFRMYDIATGDPFRILDQQIEVFSTDTPGRWSDHLGHCPEYTVVRRRMIGTNDARVGAEMVLDARLVPAASLSPAELRQTNVRTILEARLGIVAVPGRRRVMLEQLDPREVALYDLQAEGLFLRVEATTFLGDQRPFYFQTLHVPSNRITLEF